jgi:hypothetical protein
MDNIPITAMSRVNRVFDFPGYIVTKEALEKIDHLATSIFDELSTNGNIKTSVMIYLRTKEKREFQFGSISLAKDMIETDKCIVEDLELRYTKGDKYGIDIDFRSWGEICLNAFGEDPSFQFRIHSIEKEIETYDQEYSWPIRQLFLRNKVRLLVMLGIVVSSLTLLFHIFYYSYGHNVGVNIDPKLLVRGFSYFSDVDKAIKSDSIAFKLNVLLRGQLQHFDNISNIQLRSKKWIKATSISLVIFSILFAVLRIVKNLYPLAFIALGVNEKKLIRLEKQREIWLIGIVVAFVVNLLAGLAIAFIGR